MEVNTLGNALSLGWRVFARCKHGQQDHGSHARRCSYRAELDLETLVWTRGRDFTLARLAIRLKCPEIRRHGEIALRMVRHQHRLCLIERGSSPTDFAMFHPTHAVQNTSLLHLQDEVAI